MSEWQFQMDTNRIPDTNNSLALSQADIEEFKALMKSECGVELENQEAWDRAIELVNLFRMLMGPLPEDPEHSRNETSTNQEPKPMVETPPPPPRGQLSLSI